MQKLQICRRLKMSTSSDGTM